MSGFIKLNRKYFRNFLWNEARVYSKAEAWLDLVQMARFEASTEIVNKKVIEVQRGEIPASRRFLELRWQWGSSKVSNFLKLLAKQGMITQRKNQGQTIIKLVKFNDYNSKQTTGEPQANHERTTSEPRANQNKEYKESKELNKFLLEKETKGSPTNETDKMLTTEGKEKKIPPKKRNNFIVPTITEIKEHFHEVLKKKEMETSLAEMEADKFFHHYNSNGWKVGGRSKMKSWKSAVSNWVNRIKGNENRNFNTGKTGNSSQKPKSAISFLADELRRNSAENQSDSDFTIDAEIVK